MSETQREHESQRFVRRFLKLRPLNKLAQTPIRITSSNSIANYSTITDTLPFRRLRSENVLGGMADKMENTLHCTYKDCLFVSAICETTFYAFKTLRGTDKFAAVPFLSPRFVFRFKPGSWPYAARLRRWRDSDENIVCPCELTAPRVYVACRHN